MEQFKSMLILSKGMILFLKFLKLLRPHRGLFLLLVPTLLAPGCQSYKPMPLTSDSVNKALAPPPENVVRMEAASLKHPILKPVIIDLSDGLSPDEAAVLAVLANPDLRTARDQRGIAEAQVMQAKLLPNPQLSYGLDVPTGGADQGTVNAWGLGLSWDVSALVRNAALPKAAKAEREAVDLDIAWQEWQTAEAAKMSVYRLYAQEREIEAAQDNDREQAENLELIRRALDAGQATSLDLAAAQDSANQAHSLLLDLDREEGRERIGLNRLLGLAPDDRVVLQDGIELPSRFDPPGAEKILSGLEDRRLDLLALKQGYESEEQKLRAAVLSQFPPVNVGVNQARDTSDVITTGFAVTIDLPIFDRGQAEVALEKATRQQLFDEYAARVADARSDVAAILSDVPAINAQIESGQKTLDGLDALADTYKAAYAAGQADAFDYYSVLNSAASKRLELVALKEQLMETRIALELTSGLYRIEDAPEAGGDGKKINGDKP
jgi:outer membrane protein TolC